MDVTAQVLHEVEFREAKRGGYNTQDVDEFLERLAVAVDRQDAQMREARQRVQQAEARAAEAERRLEEVEHRGGGMGTGDADETLKRTLVLAQRTADAAIREAEERAARTIAAAEDQATRMLSEARDSTAQAYLEAEDEARRAQHAARSRVLAELQELEHMRELLRSDVELLERHIEEQRDRLRLTVREMQAVIEDPATLRDVAIPAMSEVALPAPQPEPEPLPPRLTAPRQLVADPVEEVEVWDAEEEDLGWEQPEDDAYLPVQTPTPPSRTGPRDAHDEARQEGRPLLAQDRRPSGLDEDGEPIEDEDTYLAELRRAMADDRPLGPREDPDDASYEQDEAPATGRSRFGRRR